MSVRSTRNHIREVDTDAHASDEFESARSSDADPDGVVVAKTKTSVAAEIYPDAPETSKWEVFGWVSFQWSWIVFFQTVTNAFLPVYMQLIATNIEAEDHKFDVFPGVRVSGSNYYPSVVPIAIVLQIAAIVLFGTVGDFGYWRKYLLVGCSVAGSTSTALLVIVTEDTYFLAALFLVISMASLIVSGIMYNAYLPLLVANLPEVRARRGHGDHDAVEIRSANRISTMGMGFGFLAGLLLLAINIGIGAATPPSCRRWCTDCPTALGNVSVPGWAAYEYEIENGTMIEEEKYCTTAPCLAWPGINPPCGTGAMGDIVEGKCLRRGGWPMYDYTPRGARWNASRSVEADLAAAVAANMTDICTLPSTRGNAGLGGDDGVPRPDARALASDSGDLGCPHFRCARADCERGHDPSACDPLHLGFRINLLSAGLWWGLFALGTYVLLKPRPSPPLPPGVGYVRASFRRLRKTFAKVRQLRNTFLFLIAYWLASDAANTIAYGAGLIASGSPLFFGPSDLGLLLLDINLSALVGVFFYERVSLVLTQWWRRREIAKGRAEKDLDSYWVCKAMLYVNLLSAFMLPVWALPGVGLTTKAEFYTAAGLYGFQLGSLGSFSRVLLQHFTPVGCEAEFFAFLDLSTKWFSWCWPLVFVAIGEKANNRWALACVSLLFIVAMIVMSFLDTRQGHIEAQNFHSIVVAEEEDGAKDTSEPTRQD